VNTSMEAHQAWYSGRVSWLHRLVNVLEIPQAEITDRMRNMWAPNTESKYGRVNVEESIKHFLSSWENIGKSN
jgi:hypothetical protein